MHPQKRVSPGVLHGDGRANDFRHDLCHHRGERGLERAASGGLGEGLLRCLCSGCALDFSRRPYRTQAHRQVAGHPAISQERSESLGKAARSPALKLRSVAPSPTAEQRGRAAIPRFSCAWKFGVEFQVEHLMTQAVALRDVPREQQH